VKWIGLNPGEIKGWVIGFLFFGGWSLLLLCLGIYVLVQKIHSLIRSARLKAAELFKK